MAEQHEVDIENLEIDEKLETPDDWTLTDNVHLQFALLYQRPVGPDRDNTIEIIRNKFMTSSKKRITTEALWRKLCTYYNFEKLEELDKSITEQEEIDQAQQKPVKAKRRSTSINPAKVENLGRISSDDLQEPLSKRRSSRKITKRSDGSDSSRDSSISYTRRSTRR